MIYPFTAALEEVLYSSYQRHFTPAATATRSLAFDHRLRSNHALMNVWLWLCVACARAKGAEAAEEARAELLKAQVCIMQCIMQCSACMHTLTAELRCCRGAVMHACTAHAIAAELPPIVAAYIVSVRAGVNSDSRCLHCIYVLMVHTSFCTVCHLTIR